MLDCRGVFSDALARGVRRRQLWFGGDAPSLSLFLNPKTVGRSPLPLDIVNECQRGGGAARAAAASTTFTGSVTTSFQVIWFLYCTALYQVSYQAL